MRRCLTALFVILLGALLLPAQEIILNEGEAEALLGLRLDETGIEYQVKSNGCTWREHFRIDLFESDPVQLLLVRVTPDFCEAYIPYGTTIHYSWDELGIDNDQRIIVINRLDAIRVVRSGPQGGQHPGAESE